MDRLLPDIRNWFGAKGAHLRVFADADCRLEGWFKGELLVLLGHLLEARQLTSLEREANIPILVSGRRTQVDFKIGLDGNIHLCELKALCISQAAGTPRNLQFYFRDDHVGVIKDFRKLDGLEGRNKWLLAFVYPRPQEPLWNRAIASLPADLHHWEVVTAISQASNELFVTLWRAKEKFLLPQQV